MDPSRCVSPQAGASRASVSGRYCQKTNPFRLAAMPVKTYRLTSFAGDRLRQIERVAEQHQHLGRDDRLPAGARAEHVAHHRIIHLRDAVQVAEPPDIPRIAGRGRDGESLDEDVVAHQRMRPAVLFLARPRNGAARSRPSVSTKNIRQSITSLKLLRVAGSSTSSN